VILAQARQKALGDGNHVSPADLGRGLAISRTKVAQVLRPLRLAPELLNAIAALGNSVGADTVAAAAARVHRRIHGGPSGVCPGHRSSLGKQNLLVLDEADWHASPQVQIPAGALTLSATLLAGAAAGRTLMAL